MKYLIIILCLISIGVIVFFAQRSEPMDVKDLDQSMQNMSLYHDNLGIYLRQGDVDYASWLLEGMDSTLRVIAVNFDKHRKLNTTFERSYEKKLQPSIKDMRNALKGNDIPAAIAGYRILTKKCNSCHIDLDIDKTVMDLTDPEYNEGN